MGVGVCLMDALAQLVRHESHFKGVVALVRAFFGSNRRQKQLPGPVPQQALPPAPGTFIYYRNPFIKNAKILADNSLKPTLFEVKVALGSATRPLTWDLRRTSCANASIKHTPTPIAPPTRPCEAA